MTFKNGMRASLKNKKSMRTSKLGAIQMFLTNSADLSGNMKKQKQISRSLNLLALMKPFEIGPMNSDHWKCVEANSWLCHAKNSLSLRR